MNATVQSDVLLEARDLRVVFDLHDGTQFTVLDNLTLSISEGAFVAVVGPSGCGKSTLLNVISGVLAPSSGSLVSPSRGRLPRSAYVFQSPRLMPWLTVRQNLEFALKARRVPRGTWEQVVRDNLQLVGLWEFADEYPLRLSGGMQQRVGIARALVVDPDVLLLDEPFSHLDEISAKRLRSETARICGERRVTAVLVTHDLLEAVFLADEIFIINGPPGQVVGHAAVRLPRPRSYVDPALYEFQAGIADHYYGLLGER